MPAVASLRYVGRFAPSPTGPLHVGSLVAAVASYLHARQAHGEWLVRIEDIDPPREVPGAADDILRTLEAFELEWDRSVLYQSSRVEAYGAAAERLLGDGRAFRCRCSRSELRAGVDALPRRYPGTCRDRRGRTVDVIASGTYSPTSFEMQARLEGRFLGIPVSPTGTIRARRLSATCPS